MEVVEIIYQVEVLIVVGVVVFTLKFTVLMRIPRISKIIQFNYATIRGFRENIIIVTII